MSGFEYHFLHAAFDLSAVIVCFTVIFFTLIHHRIDKYQNKLFISLNLMVILNSICELLTISLEKMRFQSDAIFKVMDISRLFYFLVHNALCPMFFFYVACVCGAVYYVEKKRSLMYFSLFAITETAIILNPAFHFIYHFNEQRIYCRDQGIAAIYISAAFCFMMALIMLFSSWRALTSGKKKALMYFFSVTLLGVAVQLIWIDIKIELFAESMGVLGLMLSVEDEDDLTDAETGVYNRHSLETDLNTYFIKKRAFQLICVKLTNTDITERTMNSGDEGLMMISITDFLKELVPRYYIYLASSDTLVITELDHDEKYVSELTEKISKRFELPWMIGDTDFLLNAVVMSAKVPDRIASTSDALYMADSPVPSNIDKKILADSDLDYLMRRAAVEKAITRGLEEHNFEVYYQPTYFIDRKTVHGAEALLRLHDSVLGNVFPDEFIPLAEKMGLIDDLDDFVLCEVCRLIKSGIPMQYGLDCINVNLSVVQCMRPGFVERINKIVDSFGVDPKLVNFEITESVAASDYRILSDTIDALKHEGFLFSMDDYGTGYSNMQSIFSLDFDVVKIDKSILWSVNDGKLGGIILENSVRMIKQMKRRILVEGVETLEQAELLNKLGVDYLQGYYFSKPVPKGDFIGHIKKAYEAL